MDDRIISNEEFEEDKIILPSISLATVYRNLDDLVKAFKEDYNKCEFDVYSTEIGLVINEINYFIRHLKN